MRNKFFRTRNLSQPQILPDFFNLEKNDELRLFQKLIYSIKENRNSIKNIGKRSSRNVNNNYKSNTINHKQTIKHNLESNINLSKEYNNFCGSFLKPDYYSFAPGKKILKDLKSNGVEKTLRKHFFKKIPQANYIKKANVYSISRNKSNSSIKSKYLDLINKCNCSNNECVYIKNNTKYKNIYKKDNYIIPKKEKKVIIFEYNINKDKIQHNKKKESKINNTLLKGSFKHSFNNSMSYLSSSTSCNSKKMKNLKKSIIK